MRVLVTGGSGMLGYKLASRLAVAHSVAYTTLTHDCTIRGAGRFTLDITDRQRTLGIIRKAKPDVVIHTSALTNMDMCETNKELADAINIRGTENVVDACKEAGSSIAFISTSAVFDSPHKLLAEEDVPNPVNYYGFTKLEGERIVASSGLPYIIARTDQPYCWTEKWQKANSATRVLSMLSNNKPIKEITDWYNSPTLAENFCDVLGKLIEDGRTGTYHIAGSDFLSRHDFALKIAEAFGFSKNLVRPMDASTLRLPARRGNNRLSNTKAEKDSGIRLLGADEGLTYLREHMPGVSSS
ncbi:MAG: NAD(P)-dependent oxidoreductase [Candidatus Aenigmarchaeota archaeon]|nr:NAD(P)-dependent oxidoreductase [Candidatus Aenigmarchaeota archaeon]